MKPQDDDEFSPFPPEGLDDAGYEKWFKKQVNEGLRDMYRGRAVSHRQVEIDSKVARLKTRLKMLSNRRLTRVSTD